MTVEGCTAALVIPLFNKKNLIARSIESVMQQSRPFDEIIIVDDCSTDGSSDLVHALIEQHPNSGIRLLRHSFNGGPGASRNTGLAATTADFVCFLDADDFLEREFLASMFADLEEPGRIGMVIFRIREQASGLTRPSLQRLGSLIHQVAPNLFTVLSWSKAMIREPLFCSGGNVLLAGSLARSARFNEKVRNFEDWDYYFNICQLAEERGLEIHLSSNVGLTYSDEDENSLSRAIKLSPHLLNPPPSALNLRVPPEIRKYAAGIWLCHVSQRCGLAQGLGLILKAIRLGRDARPTKSHLAFSLLGLLIGTRGWRLLSKIRKRVLYD